MFRRTLNIVLLLAGVWLLVWTLGVLELRPRRAGVIVMLLAVGLGLNLAGLPARNFPLRVWLRMLAIVVGLASVAGVLAVRWNVQQTLATAPTEDVVLRQHLAATMRGCGWIVATILYVVASVAALPKCRRPSGGSRL